MERKLVAGTSGDLLFTSSDSGVSWTPRDAVRFWWGVASSADGSKLVAGDSGGRIYTSTDSGVTWTARDAGRQWWGVASSDDGTTLIAVELGGLVYAAVPTAIQGTTAGTAGSITGNQHDAIELQYIGNNRFMVLSYAGYLSVQ